MYDLFVDAHAAVELIASDLDKLRKDSFDLEMLHLWELLGEELLESTVAINLLEYAQHTLTAALSHGILLQAFRLVLNRDAGKQAQALECLLIVTCQLKQTKHGIDRVLSAQVSLQSHGEFRLLKDLNVAQG